MRANKWRGTEIARHGYSTRFGAGGSISKRRSEANGTGRLRAWRCFFPSCAAWTGSLRSATLVAGPFSFDLSHVVIAKPLRTFARHALVAGASAALAHALAALRALVSLAWGRGGAAAGLVGGAAGKRDKRRDNSGKQISWGHGILPSSWEQPSAASPSNRTWHAWPWPALHCRGSAGQRQCCVPGVGETAGGREASDAGGSRKKNKTETNLGKGACQTARSGLRILQAGRFVIEAAFLIPGSAKASGLQRRASYQPRKGRLTVADRYGASRRRVGACYASCLAILPETARAGSIRARGCPMLRSQREASFGSRSTPSPL